MATILLLLPAIFWPAALAVAADSRTASPADRRLFVVGSDQMVWLIVGDWDKDHDQIASRFWYREATSDRIRPATSIDPPLYRIHSCALAGQTLHVFFENQTHYRYTRNREWRAHQLPNRALPLALAGESEGQLSRLWAVVSAEVGAQVEAEWQERLKHLATAPVDSAVPRLSISALPAAAEAERVPRIVMYDGVAWQPGIGTPPACGQADGIWLAVADGRFHLFWRPAGQEMEIRYARHADGQWSLGPPIATPNFVHRADAAITNKQVVLATIVKAPDEPHRQCVQWTRSVAADAQEPWNRLPPLLTENGDELVLSTRTALGLFSDRLALLRLGDKGPEAGFWLAASGGKPDQAFAALPVSTASDGRSQNRNVRDFLTTVAVAAMLLLVFWRRQESIAAPVNLPAGLQVVGPAKRTLAFMIDAAPALAIMLWWWFGPISTYYHEFRAAAAGGEQPADAPREVVWAWFWFRVIYTAYCTAFEGFLAATPGKRLLGCQVLSETLDRANLLQIGVRNVARMIELEPYLKIWPFLFVILFTRNRQRMGDLLARTIVVEHQTVVPSDPDRGTDPPPED
ncbi:MAG: RDD family protein [Planctomycetes bacterium]|nr:RDD family protein [Planctomycetota bacterium]